MNIEKLNNYAVKIFLSDSDLNAYDICFQEMNSQNTAALILSLADEIMDCCGINISDKKLIAEVFPQKNGCTIFISFSPSYHKIQYKKIQFTVSLDKYEQLKEFCRFLQKTPEYHIRSSSLYFNGLFFCLIILCDGKSADSLYKAAEKYGYPDYTTEISEAAIKEYFTCIESQGAVRKAAAI
ncbi:MAG: adaptor protein MecA [Porcipelethomonas sp.]